MAEKVHAFTGLAQGLGFNGLTMSLRVVLGAGNALICLASILSVGRPATGDRLTVRRKRMVVFHHSLGD